MSEESELINYYPVRRLIAVSKSVDRSHSGGRKKIAKPTRKIKSKENVIDSENKLAVAFWARKLLLKAWKSFLIQKMRSIHSSHATKLSNAYYTRKLLFKHLMHWKYYVKRVVPEERTTYIA